MTICIASGYFDPLHVGHIEYFRKAATHGKLYVIVNNDTQATLKKGKPFMNEQDRLTIIQALKMVTHAELSIDTDKTVKKTLQKLAEKIRKEYPNETIYFVNGGDRNNNEIPETPICKQYNITQLDGLGEKIRSSSTYIAEAKRF